MKLSTFSILVFLLLVALFVATTFWPDLTQQEVDQTVIPSPAEVPRQPAIRHPMPAPPIEAETPSPTLPATTTGADTVAPVSATAPAPVPLREQPGKKPSEPLLSLAESDDFLQRLLPHLYTDQKLIGLFIPSHLIDRWVITVDNLPEKSLPDGKLFLKRPRGHFLVTSKENPAIAQENAARYTLYRQLLTVLPTKKMVALYSKLYPLVQQAYEKLGYPDGYFNDRLVDVIDHLLQTPDPQEPIHLQHHINRYRYMDEELEALSAGQKILLRMGRENRTAIMQRLREIRQLIAKPAD